MWPFNRDIGAEVKERRACRTGAWKKPTVDPVEGRQRVELYSKHCDASNYRVEMSQAEVGDERCQQLLSHIANASNKVSRLHLDKRKDAFAVGIEK